MRQERGNVAVARPLTPTSTSTQVKAKKQPLIKGLTVPEKLLYIGSVIICVALTVLVVSRYAETAELNLAIQKADKEIQQVKEANLQLEAEKNKLQSDARIRQYAEQNGLQIIESKKISSAGKEKNTP
ncbi:cell division protein FtsL [Baia soyae]|uniref:Cell division protein FtsL n=1 Tax=Baia soyae TaxID=1544746 RepID=A0A4R2S3C8_9BACL|nr:cell division protein FtsL [Baia soyae]TCP70434.1 cell division protein FtsL [Baia soyae]